MAMIALASAPQVDGKRAMDGCQIYQYAGLATAAQEKENKVPRRYLQMSLFSNYIRRGVLQKRLDRAHGLELYLLSVLQISSLEADLLLHVLNKDTGHVCIPEKEEAAGKEESTDEDVRLAAEL